MRLQVPATGVSEAQHGDCLGYGHRPWDLFMLLAALIQPSAATHTSSGLQVDDDMFGPGSAAPAAGGAVKKGLLDNYDDVEGYYNFQVRVQTGRGHLSRSIRMCIRQSTAQAHAAASSAMLTALAGRAGGCTRSAVVMGGRFKAEKTRARTGRAASEMSRVSRWRLSGKASFRRACLACCLTCTQAEASLSRVQHLISNRLLLIGQSACTCATAWMDMDTS